jgi:hypothetical protein
MVLFLVDTASYQAAIVKIMYRQYTEVKSKSSWPYHWMMPDLRPRRGNRAIWSNRNDPFQQVVWLPFWSFFAPDEAGKEALFNPN